MIHTNIARLLASTLIATLMPVAAAIAQSPSSDAGRIMADLSALDLTGESRSPHPGSHAIAAAKARGYRIHRGQKTWASSLTPACAEPPSEDLVFFVNNPVTLYGGASIPVDPGGASDELTAIYPLQGDDVIVVYGYTPAPITYYSFTMNQKRLYDENQQDYQDTNSSIGLSINQDNIKTLKGQPFGDFFALIVTANYAAADLAEQFLNRVGVPSSAINFLYYPQRFSSTDTATPDDLTLLTRLTFRDQAEADVVCGFPLAEPANMNVLFFEGPGGAGDVEDGDLVSWEETLRDDTSEWDAGADIELGILTDRVRQHYERLGYAILETGEEFLTHVEPELQCRALPRPCNFDAPDALYGQFVCDGGPDGPRVCTAPLPSFREMVVVTGVNHHRFAADTLGAYFSYAVTRRADLQGVATIVDVDTLGSADQFVEGTSLDPADFFVLQIARYCGERPACMEVPWTAVPPSGPILITPRIYLDRVTAAGPNPANFVPSRLLRLQLGQPAR